jgi:hypothetical protein
VVVEDPSAMVDEDCAGGSDRHAGCPGAKSGTGSETASSRGSEDGSVAADVVREVEDARHVSRS